MRIEITESFFNDRQVIVKTSEVYEDSVVIEVGYTGGRRYEATLNRAAVLALSLAIRAVVAEMEEDEEEEEED